MNPRTLALLAIAMASACRDNMNPMHGYERNPAPKKPIGKPVPTDAGEFFFCKDGNLVDKDSEEIVFTCIARNKKNALRKFSNFKKTNGQA